jgi:dihydrofolate reductase
MNTFKAIAAMSENRVIGNAGDIPWHLPKDFKWFKTKTMGGVLVMGRKTYESIGGALPGRETYVFSRQPRELPDARCFTNIGALQQLKTDKTIWIAGGGEIYTQTLDHCTELYLTRVHRTVEGDAFFPTFEDRFKLDSIIESNEDYTIELWLKQ